MDGWAVRSSAFSQGPPDTSGWILGRDYVRADMGDDFDDAFDAVVLVEDVTAGESGPIFPPDLKVLPGLNVRRAGAQIAEGDLLARAGRPLLPKDLAMLQMGGLAAIEVAKKPLVAFIPTGAELISPGPPPARGQNIDTNSLLVARTLEGWGAEAWLWPVVADDPGAIAAALDLSLSRADVVILNGGSSKGGEDHNAKLLSSRARTLFKGVAAAPGKPMAAFLAGDRLVVNLPGPMIAAYYGLEWCLKWIVARALGVSPAPRPKVLAVLSEPLEAPEALSFLFNIKLTKAPDGSWSARPLDPRKAKTSEGIDANAQYMSVLGQGRLPAGQAIWVEALRPEEVLEG
jgi:molybdopterin molybdotransferase/putative molybdopterin biosynthesis protein